ncbi:hypothetical protein M231_05749 [Tremella mesenterica]|uniref:Uncharacterized protein n=1 Tax=Tremella mesenterica TaxID=5217 RepID=A0A4Q1BHA8_TREME|nr:hypothetical protein M231_05749 [Tremella mesenterica]
MANAGYVDYYGQTFMGTQTAGNSFSFTFHAEAVYMYGSKWYNHGYYSVSLDGGQAQYSNGNTDGTRYFQQCLYSATGLSTGSHTIVVTNTPNMQPQTGEIWFDLDFIVLTLPTTSQIHSTTFDDPSSAFTYSDNGGWSQTTHSSHSTDTTGSSVSFSFTGSSVQVFGQVGPQNGNYSISLDQVVEQPYNGTHGTTIGVTSLYLASGLSDSPHTLVITNIANDRGSLLDINYAIVNSSLTPTSSSIVPSTALSNVSSVVQSSSTTTTTSFDDSSISSSSPGSTATSSSTSSSSTASGAAAAVWADKTSSGSSEIPPPQRTGDIAAISAQTSTTRSGDVGAVVGGTVAAVVLLILAMILGVWLWRRRRRRGQIHLEPSPISTNPRLKSSSESSLYPMIDRRGSGRGGTGDVRQRDTIQSSILSPIWSPNREVFHQYTPPQRVMMTYTDLPPLDIPSAPTPAFVRRLTYNPEPAPSSRSPEISRQVDRQNHSRQLSTSSFNRSSTRPSPSSRALPSSGIPTAQEGRSSSRRRESKSSPRQGKRVVDIRDDTSGYRHDATQPFTSSTNEQLTGALGPSLGSDDSPSSALKTELLNMPFRRFSGPSEGASSRATMSVFGRERDAGPATPEEIERAALGIPELPILPPNYQQATQKRRR